MTYLITGATGGLGGYALHALDRLVPREEIIALARSEAKAKPLRDEGFTVRIGDYGDAESLKRAFDGIDRLLFVSGIPGNRQQEHTNVVDAAQASGVRFIAYTSFPKATAADNMLSVDHVFTERLIEQSGIAHTFLRNNWYLENETTLIDLALRTGTLYFAAGDATVGWALKREYAEAAARTLAATDSAAILELSGKPTTYAELADALGKASHQRITPESLTNPQALSDALAHNGLPQQAIQGTLGIQQLIAHGDLEVQSNDFESTLGHPLTSLPDALTELLANHKDN